jgi:hypothetical protein
MPGLFPGKTGYQDPPRKMYAKLQEEMRELRYFVRTGLSARP